MCVSNVSGVAEACCGCDAIRIYGNDLQHALPFAFKQILYIVAISD